MKSCRLIGLAALGLSAGTLLAEGRVDAVNDVSNTWQPRQWNVGRSWKGYRYPQGGGIATFPQNGKISNDRGASQEFFSQNVAGLELKGLDFGNFFSLDFNGQAITFVGCWPWINSTQATVGNEMMLNVGLKGTGHNTLVKKGAGRIVAGGVISDFESLDVNGGAFVIQEEKHAFGVPVRVKGGGLSFEPKTAGDAAAVDTVVADGGIGYLAAKNGGALTVNTLEKRTGAVLNVRTSGGAKVMVANKTAATAPDGGLVSLPGDGTVKFLDYDETDGWKAGDSTPANAVVCTDAETGAIAFANEGYVWRPAAAGGASLKVTGPVSAPGGVTFSTAPDDSDSANRTKIDLSALSGVTAPLRFNGMIVSGLKPDSLVAGGELWVCGDGANLDNAATVTFDAQAHKEQPFNLSLHLAGAGVNYGFLSSGGNWQYKTLTLTGPTVLEGDTTVGAGSSVVTFKGPVSGPGGMILKDGFVRFHVDNSFAGDLQVENGASVSLYENGSLGAGDVKLKGDTGRLYFHAWKSPVTITNRFTGTEGVLAAQNSSTAALTEAVTVRSAYVQKASTLKLAKDLRTDHVYLDHDSTIVAAGGDVTLTAGSSGDSVLAGTLADGTAGERLSLTKTGANRLVICGTNNTYSGATRIDAGKVVLGGSLFGESDVSWWVDAADASTLTVKDGMVTEWRSKVGSYKFTGSASNATYPAPTYVTDEDYFNGKPFLRFVPEPTGKSDTFNTKPQLTGSGSAEIRTAFIVCRTRTGVAVTHAQGGLITYGWNDCSLRVTTDGYINTSSQQAQDFWPTAGYGRENGKRVNGNISTVKIAGANIVGVFAPQHYVGGGGYAHYSKFTPYLGSTDRPWNGDLGEIIAFRRVLTDAECCAVENYLMAKWNPTRTTQHTAEECALPSKRNLLPATTELQLGADATLDLNGGEQTVAKLTGSGTIVNTSAEPATLVVTGESDFHGKVDGNVTLVLPAGAREIVLRNGAKLVVAGPTEATVAAANPKPPIHDLAFWIDASQSDLVTTNASGEVTRILCREKGLCDAGDFHPASGSAYMTYAGTGWNSGKPAFYMNAAKSFYLSGNGSGSDKSTTVRTLFYVARLMSNGTGSYVFGPNGADVGATAYAWNGGYTINCRGPSLLNTVGDLLRLNGVDRTFETAGGYNIYRSDNAICYVMRVCDSHMNDGHLEKKVMCLGSHSGTRALTQYVGEMIGYTTQLTDAEILETEKYLMDKWLNSGTEWPTPETTAYDATCGLGVAGGATLDLGAGAVTLAALGGNGGTVKAGSLTVTDEMDFLVADGAVDTVTVDGNLTLGSQALARVVNGEALDKAKSFQTALSVTGGVTGDFAGVDGLPRQWSWSRSGNTWTIGRNGVMLIIR